MTFYLMTDDRNYLFANYALFAYTIKVRNTTFFVTFKNVETRFIASRM